MVGTTLWKTRSPLDDVIWSGFSALMASLWLESGCIWLVFSSAFRWKTCFLSTKQFLVIALIKTNKFSVSDFRKRILIGLFLDLILKTQHKYCVHQKPVYRRPNDWAHSQPTITKIMHAGMRINEAQHFLPLIIHGGGYFVTSPLPNWSDRWRGAKTKIMGTQTCIDEAHTIEAIFERQFDIG